MTTGHKPTRALLSLRSFVLIVVAIAIAIAASALTYWKARSMPDSLLVGAAAFGATLKLLHNLVE